MGAVQFTLLARLGLREHHRLLDIGCGSLRAGRLFIPYLLPERYFGIEPERWLVRDGLRHELGGAIVRVKRPRFLYAGDAAAGCFGVTFDYALAQSIFTHAPLHQVHDCLAAVSRCLAPNGLLVASFARGTADEQTAAWRYPDIVRYTEATLARLGVEAGLESRVIDWEHPNGLTWMAFGSRPALRALEAVGPTPAPALSAADLQEGKHRGMVGGLWEEIGRLQLDFLLREGLVPTMRLLDLGCGCLRGGLHFVAYLEPAHYFGIDSSKALLDTGYDWELARAGLQHRLPRSHLLCDDQFRCEQFGVAFDVTLAQSVFTHLPLNSIRLCLTRLARCVPAGGRFYATFFEVPPGEALEADRRRPQGIVTHSDRDPYHYRLEDLVWAASGLPWRTRYVGEWGHPRGQMMVCFERTA